MEREQQEQKHNNVITELGICHILLLDLHRDTNELQYMLSAVRIQDEIDKLEFIKI